MNELQVILANWMNALAVLLPFGYSFGAGMVSTVNPCGFSLLPAYLSLYLGGRDDGTASSNPLLRGGKALVIGIAVTLGFVILFSVVGVIIWAGGHFLMRYLSWLGLFVGAVLACLGLFLLAGKSVYTSIPPRLANLIGNPKSQGFNTYFLFGIGYGMASLGCTLPVFLVVVGSAIKSQGLTGGLFQFISYSLGMGAVLTVLALSFALFKGGLATYLSRALPYMGRVAGALLLVSGSYQIHYWLTKGGLLAKWT
jgi:cytochrome c biogenesis protein CcdA